MTVSKLFILIGSIALVLTVLRYLFQGYKKVILSYLQNFVGTLFIFSGFVKAVDPMGTSIKMHEYFELRLFQTIVLSILSLHLSLLPCWSQS